MGRPPRKTESAELATMEEALPYSRAMHSRVCDVSVVQSE